MRSGFSYQDCGLRELFSRERAQQVAPVRGLFTGLRSEMGIGVPIIRLIREWGLGASY